MNLFVSQLSTQVAIQQNHLCAQKEQMNKELNAVDSQGSAALQKLQTQYNQSINAANANINQLKKANDEVFAEIKKRLLFSKQLNEVYVKIEGAIQEETARYGKLNDCMAKFSENLKNSQSDIVKLENLWNQIDTDLQNLKKTKTTLESQIESSLVKQKKTQEEIIKVSGEIDKLRNAIYCSNDEQIRTIAEQSSQIFQMSALFESLFLTEETEDN